MNRRDGIAPKVKTRRQHIDALVTLLVWDAHAAVLRMLDSIERQADNRARWRLFILDQGSAPPTADLLDQFVRRRPELVHLERISENIGYPAGHNLLHRIASRSQDPRYVVTLNSDLVLNDPNWLDILVEFMDANPMVGIAGPTGVIYQRTPPERLGWCRVALSQEMRSGKFDSISGSICILREQMLRDIGYFDESFTPGYFEDTDLAFRAKACGWQLAAIDVPHAHQDLGPEQSTSHIKREQLAAKYGNFQKRNRNLFVERWLTPGPPPLNSSACRSHFPGVYFPEYPSATEHVIAAVT